MINIGHERECFFDDYLIDTEKTTAKFKVHNPTYKGPVMRHDEFWEGDGSDYHNFFYDNGIWRMYYLGWKTFGPREEIFACYAESKDGINWTKPSLGIVEYRGTKDNNILLPFGVDNFMVFRDDNPACEPDKKYKAVADKKIDENHHLYSYYSEDGIHFREGELICSDGRFDSLNVAFWDEKEKRYLCYFRGYHDIDEKDMPKSLGPQPIRDIRVIESPDFKVWTKFKRVNFGDCEDIPLYTNVVQPYYRAPQYYVGFPTRYIERPEWNGTYDELCGKEKRLQRIEKSKRYGLVVTDCVFMSSRDGYNFKRHDEAFMPPMPENGRNWVYGDSYVARGMIETPSDVQGAESEISIFAFDNHWGGHPSNFIRFTIRKDGFVSLRAGAEEEKVVTKPFVFEGEEMRINFATSARGYMYFTLIDENGNRYDSLETFGNLTDRKVVFGEGVVKSLSGKPVTLEVIMRDSDLYAIRFA